MNATPNSSLDIDTVIDEYLARVPNGRKLYLNDALFHAHIHWIRTAWPPLDRVLAAQGIDDAAREQAARTLVYGNPDPDEAIAALQRLDTVLDRLQASALGDQKPGHQFTGVDGLFDGYQS